MKLQRGIQNIFLQAVSEILECLERKLYKTWKRHEKISSKEAEKDGSLTDNTIPELKDLRKGLINS